MMIDLYLFSASLLDNNTFYVNTSSTALYNRYELFYVPLINSLFFHYISLYNKPQTPFGIGGFYSGELYDIENSTLILHNYLFLRLFL